jgi:hypothetical protein
MLPLGCCSGECTLEHQPLTLVLVEHICRFPLDRLIAVALRPRHLQHLAIQLEAVHFLNGLERRLFAVEDEERLALALQTALRNDVEYGAVALEDLCEGLLHRVDLYALLEVVDLGLSACATVCNVSALCGQLTYILHSAVSTQGTYLAYFLRLTFRWARGTWTDPRPFECPPSCRP